MSSFSPSPSSPPSPIPLSTISTLLSSIILSLQSSSRISSSSSYHIFITHLPILSTSTLLSLSFAEFHSIMLVMDYFMGETSETSSSSSPSFSSLLDFHVHHRRKLMVKKKISLPSSSFLSSDSQNNNDILYEIILDLCNDPEYKISFLTHLFSLFSSNSLLTHSSYLYHLSQSFPAPHSIHSNYISTHRGFIIQIIAAVAEIGSERMIMWENEEKERRKREKEDSEREREKERREKEEKEKEKEREKGRGKEKEKEKGVKGRVVSVSNDGGNASIITKAKNILSNTNRNDNNHINKLSLTAKGNLPIKAVLVKKTTHHNQLSPTQIQAASSSWSSTTASSSSSSFVPFHLRPSKYDEHNDNDYNNDNGHGRDDQHDQNQDDNTNDDDLKYSKVSFGDSISMASQNQQKRQVDHQNNHHSISTTVIKKQRPSTAASTSSSYSSSSKPLKQLAPKPTDDADTSLLSQLRHLQSQYNALLSSPSPDLFISSLQHENRRLYDNLFRRRRAMHEITKVLDELSWQGKTGEREEKLREFAMETGKRMREMMDEKGYSAENNDLDSEDNENHRGAQEKKTKNLNDPESFLPPTVFSSLSSLLLHLSRLQPFSPVSLSPSSPPPPH